MTGTTQNQNHPVRNFVYMFVLLIIIWLALTSSFHWQELTIGILFSLILAVVLSSNYGELGLPPLNFRRIAYFCIYIVVLLKEIIIANIDVAYRVIHPRMPIRPGVVVIKTGLKQDIAKLILANSITLTPGTFTLDILGDVLLIHWINIKDENVDQATRIIGERFEKYLREIFK